MKVIYRQRALADIDDIFQYLQKRNQGAARNVVHAINEAISALADQPFASQRTSNPDIRVRLASRCL
jgi:plasmid stabilization system protein ParE